MKTTLVALFLTITSTVFAQINEVNYVDFYQWNGANDGINYTVMIVSDDFLELEDAEAVVRVKYTTEGIGKMVEYNATIAYDVLDSYLDFFYMGEDTATFLKGSGSYTPDNFLISYDYEGNFLEAFQADHNELDKGEDGILAELTPIFIQDVNHFRELIKEFYTSDDELYRKLMTYAANFD